ncbi:hypothetical protein [Marinomonas sp.]|uniref:hypothetical protein n=1 Tax=Marinomonas sp. TaxID=1904862 RepID=UPI003BAA0E27
MKPDFSEFSYGYAVTEELASSLNARLVGSPIFPSLYAEGQKGGGYDVKLPTSGTALFLQFKLSDYLERANAKEHRDGVMDVPYYRMHIRPTKHSDQHNLLLGLEDSGESVFYIAPEFHLPRELNDYYLNKTVIRNSAAFAPKDIGVMPDDDDHYLVFDKASSIAHRCSEEPKEVRKSSLSNGFRALLMQRDVRHIDVNERNLRSLASNMLEVLESSESRLKKYRKSIDIDGIKRIVDERDPVSGISYMARTFYDSELVIMPD